MQGGAVQPFEGVQHRAVGLSEQPPRDVDAVTGIDADQMRIEGGVVDLGQGHPVLDNRLTQQFILVRNDVRGVEEERLP